MPTPLEVTVALVLLPLLPAACIYWLLTPRTMRGGAADSAAGTIRTAAGPTVFGVHFNVVGSTAVYFVILLSSFLIYYSSSEEQLREQTIQQAALKDGMAWLVKMPVGAEMGASGNPRTLVTVPLDPAIQKQLVVDIQPNYEMYGDALEFWVTPQFGQFPSVTVQLPNVSSSQPVNLNDLREVERDYAQHEMTVVGKQWLILDKSYNPSTAHAVGGK